MRIECKIDGRERGFELDPTLSLRELLVRNGNLCVRDSDDGEGFCGSDTVLVDGTPVYANLMLAGEVDGREVRTPAGLGEPGKLSYVQQALIDAGVVQSAYNSPATALLLTWLLENEPNPTREQVKDALSGIYIRDASYENYYLAVKLACELRDKGGYESKIAPDYRPELSYVGKPGSKVDGPQLVRGERAFVEDFVDPDACHLVMLRSPYASAYINSIDASAAEALPGVVAVITCFNCPDITYMQAGQGNPEPSPHDTRLFNHKVRFVGDRVAAVIAETKEIAREACGLISVDYQVLDPVFSVEEAMAEGAPRVHDGIVEYGVGAPEDLDEYNKDAGDEREGKVFYPFPLRADIHRNIAASNKGGIGDVERGFAEADAIVDETYRTTNVQQAPLEPHLCYAKMEGGRLQVYASTQVPYHVRRIVSWVCGLPQNKIHVVKTRVGGGYGSKQDILVEDVCAYAAYATHRPVYYRHTRAEELVAASARHPMRVRVKMGAKKDGSITAIFMEVRANTGAYGNHCLTVPMNSCSKVLPLFKVDNMAYDLITYYSNKLQPGAYQGYGTPKGSYGIMMAMAQLAEKLGIDFKDMAVKNHVETGYRLEILKGLGEGREGNVVPVGSCGLDECIRRGCEMIEWGKREESDDPDWKIGKGFAMIMQGSGLPGLDHAEAICKLETDGTVILNSGGADIGTGLDTISTKVAAEILHLPLELVSVISGDTDSAAFDTGSYASSGTFFSGNASVDAARKLARGIIAEAALQMGEVEADLELRYPGEVHSTRTDATLSYGDLSHACCAGDGRGQVVAHGSFITTANAIPYGAHFAQVAVNVRTGQVKVQKYYALQDAGTPINPELAQCQMYGAALKSIGHTLYEDMTIDEKGRPLRTTLTDYGVPMIFEQPDDFKAVMVDVNDADGPFGAKSISEIACNGAAPAIGNAIHDACGVWMRSWPMTPEKVLRELGRI
ncbi:molybdopterin-dependent oxidoreductase Mo/Fe-S-binding subunit [uncultured Olsenella sp.]|uniref:molybdopterin-dependent oxidoreductase Mo/Fe-S-binding subunit n=1 Tax=uncultured Olsenella sp. TaxID=190764 RepID=UPI0026DD4BCD|nr:molybdopterin-dependent oxidoreductase Mo/Fe-S-binding subunit [uncultured Olsenella sp.]